MVTFVDNGGVFGALAVGAGIGNGNGVEEGQPLLVFHVHEPGKDIFRALWRTGPNHGRIPAGDIKQLHHQTLVTFARTYDGHRACMCLAYLRAIRGTTILRMKLGLM